jgi:hypothetical protein
LRDIDIIGAGQQIAVAKEPDAIGDDVQNAAPEQEPLALGLRLQESHGQVMFL